MKDKEPKKLHKKEKKQEKIILTSTQSFSPIRDIRDGIIITKDGRFVKIMEVTPINFSLLPAEEKTAVISAFRAVISVMPGTVQFKIKSSKPDPKKYENKLQEDIRIEKVAACRELIQDQKDTISRISEYQGVDKRLFIIFEYETDDKFRRSPRFEQVKHSLSRTAHEIRAALEMCGNTVISQDTNEYTEEVVYSVFCRSDAENAMTYAERKETVEGFYDAIRARDPEAKFVIPINEYLAPTEIEPRLSAGYIKVDNLFYRFCYIPSEEYPNQAFGGWLSRWTDLGEGVDVDFWFHKEDTEKTLQKLGLVLKYNKVKERETEDTSAGYEELNDAIGSGYYFKSGIAADQSFCYMGTMITITGFTVEELDYKYTEIRQYFAKQAIRLRTCVMQQLEAFKSSLPICQYDKGIWSKSKRNILSGDLASAYPFDSYELNDDNGIFLGTNHKNGSLVFVDPFDDSKYTNHNIIIMGSSGAGKTYTLSSMALRMRERQIQTTLIAPAKGEEFERMCDAIGGTFIRIATGSEHNINVMEIRKKDETEREVFGTKQIANESELLTKIASIQKLFSLMIKDINDEDKQVLDEALLETYAAKGITEKNKSLWDPARAGQYKPMPTLEDLYKTLEEKHPEEGRHILRSLKRYVYGSARIFSRPTNVNLDNKFIVIDVSHLTEELLPIGMFIALDMVWDKAKEDRRKKKMILIDEAWKLVGASSTEQAADFVKEIFKTIRGYGGGAVAATQDLNDFFALKDGAYGAAIVNNSNLKLLLRTEPKEAMALANAMDLTSVELDAIKKAQRGTALLAVDKNHLFIDIKASQKEHNLITTSREELERLSGENM